MLGGQLVRCVVINGYNGLNEVRLTRISAQTILQFI